MTDMDDSQIVRPRDCLISVIVKLLDQEAVRYKTDLVRFLDQETVRLILGSQIVVS